MPDVWVLGERQLIVKHLQDDTYDIVEIDEIGAIVEREGIPELPEGARRLVMEEPA